MQVDARAERAAKGNTTCCASLAPVCSATSTPRAATALTGLCCSGLPAALTGPPFPVPPRCQQPHPLSEQVVTIRLEERPHKLILVYEVILVQLIGYLGVQLRQRGHFVACDCTLGEGPFGLAHAARMPQGIYSPSRGIRPWRASNREAQPPNADHQHTVPDFKMQACVLP